MMKKMVLTALVLALSAPALANDAVKLNFVKKLYRNSLDNLTDDDIINKYGSAELKRLMRMQPSDEPCHLDYSTGATQDMDNVSNRYFTYSIAKNNRVQVSYRIFGERFVSEYLLSCNGSRCVVNDIFLNGDSMKADLKSCVEN